MSEDLKQGVTLRWGQLFQWIVLGLVLLFALWQHLRLSQVEKQLDRLQTQAVAPAVAPLQAQPQAPSVAPLVAKPQPPRGLSTAPKPRETHQMRMATITKAARENNKVVLPRGLASKRLKKPISVRGRDRKGKQSPEEVAQQRLKELKRLVGEGPQLERALAILSQEAQGRRQLEQKAREGTLSREGLRKALMQLRTHTDEQIEQLLTPKLFDQYRELRQSWSKGRPHPDPDE